MSLKKTINAVLLAALLVVGGGLLYMNVRDADPILPGWADYNAARFDSLMAGNEPVLVEIYASWCPTCLVQQRAFEALAKSGNGPKVRAIRVDFDRDTAFIKAHGYKATGLLVIYRNGQEVARAAGLTSAAAVAAFLSANGISS